MADANQLSILLVTDNKDYTESLGKLINSHYPKYTVARTEAEVLNLLEKKPVDLMILGFETVQQNEVFYLHLLRANRSIDQCISYIMLLAIKQDVQTAFDSCIKNIFNDYFLACPLYDLNYMLIRLREIERLLYYRQQSGFGNLPLDEVEAYLEQMLTSGERLGQLTDETEQRLQQTLHDAMNHIRQQLEQQGTDPGTLKQISLQAQISNTSQLVNNPQAYESQQLISNMVEQTRQQQEKLGQASRGRSNSPEDVNAHLTDKASLSEQLASEGKQARMDQISQQTPCPEHGVMIIEDEMKQLSSINEVLARIGIITYPVQTGTEALKKMADWKPAIALVDLTLPDTSALHVISRIRNHPALEHTRIIAMANQNERDIVLEAAKAGIKQVVLKPVDKKLLVQRIQNNLEAVKQQASA